MLHLLHYYNYAVLNSLILVNLTIFFYDYFLCSYSIIYYASTLGLNLYKSQLSTLNSLSIFNALSETTK